MRRQAWTMVVGVVVGLVVLAAGAAWLTLQPGGPAWPGAAAKAAGAAASAPLLFRANEVVQPVLASLPQRIEFSGPLVAPNTAVLRARTAGTLLALAVSEGARVKAGQVLGRIDMAGLAPRIAERSAMLDAARATLAQAERSHANNQRLAAQSFISPSALDVSLATLDTTRASLAAAQATLDASRVGQRDASLVAPIAGIVAKRHVLPGETLQAAQPVLTIVDLARLELAASVGTHEVARLQPGMAVRVTVEGVHAPLTGQLTRIAPAAESGTRSIGVTVLLANAQERLRAGQYAVGQVVLADDQQRLLLPAAAVGSSGGQHHVWVIAQGVLARRAVTLGRRDEAGGRVEVQSGISADAWVLATRFDNLREGAKALVSGRAPASPAGPASPASLGAVAVAVTVAASATAAPGVR